MATALAQGCVRAGQASPEGIVASDPLPEARSKFVEGLPGATCLEDNRAVLEMADAVVLAVKPQMMDQVLATIRDAVEPRHLLASIAAGIPLARLAAALPPGTRLVRVMPNTPCLVGMGASGYSLGRHAAAADGQTVRTLLESVGEAFEVEETLLDTVTGLSGSGPAFVYSMIEALAAGGVAMGLSAETALQLAAQTARGAAEMVRQTGLSPAELRAQVMSPGGTTVAGLEALTRLEGPAAFEAAVVAATQRSRELGQS